MGKYDRVRLLWPDHLGLARGKYLPMRLADQGTNHVVTTFGLGYDRTIRDVSGGYLHHGLPDVHSSIDSDLRPSWEDDRTAVAIGHLTLGDEPYPVAARHVLQRAIADWAALGYTVKVGLELEAYVLEPDSAGGWRRWSTPQSFVYATGRAADPVGLIDDITWTAERCRFRPESINAEFDESQFELTLEYDDALRAADDAFLFRVMARETALKHGLDLTFMGKPFSESAGNGVHVNVSLVDAAGNNAFADPAAADGLSALAKSTLAGLCRHHPAMTALCAPTVNAYRRLQPGALNGYWGNWGYAHRCAGSRVPETRGDSTRVESRLSDGSANIHLAVAAVLQAARLGVVHQYPCPAPLAGDGFEDPETDVRSADSLGEALDDLRRDQPLSEAVGPECVANFIDNKQAEWEQYLAAVGTDVPGPDVTKWELDMYRNFH